MTKEATIDFIKSKGINNPENPTGKDIEKLLGMIATTTDKSDEQFFKSYFAAMPNVGKAVFDGITKLADATVSKEYIDSINQVIQVLNKEYEKAETKEEREDIYEKIEELLDRIGEEASNDRKFKKQLGLYLSGTAFIIGGIAVAVKRPDVAKDLLNKGVGMIKRR